MKRFANTLVWLIIAGAVIALLTTWLREKPARVDTSSASRGPLRVTVDGEGKTRVRDRYVIGAPVAGRLRRVTLRRGDTVEQGQIIAQIDPVPLAPLDPRQRAEAVGRVNAAEDTKREVDRMVDRYKASYEQSVRDLNRAESLARDGVIARQELEKAQTEVSTALHEYNGARSKAESAAHEVEVARAALLTLNQTRNPQHSAVEVQAPTKGKVLQVLEESERVVTAGAPLIELSNPSNLEVVIELLSTDAVKVSPGALVVLDDWGGPHPLEARVRLVEPSAFTKISALGIEEQRVNVVADLTEPALGLGDAYRVEGRIVVWESDDCLQAPVSALFRHADGWGLFVVQDGVAHLRQVEIGQRTPLMVEIKSGLEEGVEVITHPSNQINDGVRVEAVKNE